MHIRTATLDDIPGAAATLAEAFDDYPWTRWSLPADDYAARLERVQGLYLRHALAHGIVLVAEDLCGVAALLPPDCPAPPEPVQIEVAELMGDRAAIVFGVELPSRPNQSWDLATVGVRPARAGQGIGAALIREGLRRVSASPYPHVSLETSSDRNVALYERFGFAVAHRTQIVDGPMVTTMGVELEFGITREADESPAPRAR